MNSILSSFGISEAHHDEFSAILKETSAIVAGSAPLAALVGGFTPGDMDIWFYPGLCEPHDTMFTKDAYERMCMILGKFHDFFSELGYTVNHEIAGTDKHMEEEGYSEMQVIRKMDRYFHPTNLTVQVIVTMKPILETLESFDISVCRTWWDGEKLYTWDQNTTLLRGMYPARPLVTEREQKRWQKYKDRGFTVYTEPTHTSYTHPDFHKESAIISINGYQPLSKTPAAPAKPPIWKSLGTTLCYLKDVDPKSLPTFMELFEKYDLPVGIFKEPYSMRFQVPVGIRGNKEFNDYQQAIYYFTDFLRRTGPGIDVTTAMLKSLQLPTEYWCWLKDTDEERPLEDLVKENKEPQPKSKLTFQPLTHTETYKKDIALFHPYEITTDELDSLLKPKNAENTKHAILNQFLKRQDLLIANMEKMGTKAHKATQELYAELLKHPAYVLWNHEESIQRMYDAYKVLMSMGDNDINDHILCFTLRSYISMVMTLVDHKNY